LKVDLVFCHCEVAGNDRASLAIFTILNKITLIIRINYGKYYKRSPHTCRPAMFPTKPQPLTLPDVEFEAFDVLNYGSVAAPAKPSRFGFQIDVSPSAELGQIVFGLMQEPQRVGVPRIGFGVRVDLERGEIWDVVNGSGLIGWVEAPLGSTADGKPESILFSLEIERIGSALLPKLQVGGEEWLYPAVRSLETFEFTAIAGCRGTSEQNLEASDLLTNASLWTEASER
jgi:hypothetical protein